MRILKNALGWAAAVLLLLAVAPAPAGAQETVDTLRRQFRLPQPVTYVQHERSSWITPALAVGVPSGFGADYGDAFAGVAFQYRTRSWRRPDGGAVVGFGLGDAQRLVGLEVALTSYGTVRSCCRGALGLKVHRVLPGDVSVAVGAENLVVHGFSDSGRNVYGVGSKVFLLRRDPTSLGGTLALTAGVGNGRFRSEDDILLDQGTVGPFGSVGVRLAPPAGLVASWTGHSLVAGVSVVPFRRVPLFITPAVADIGRRERFVLGVGYGINYGSIF
jgi:hypothetical protein